MSKWTHNICGGCWDKQSPDIPPLAVLKTALKEKCCFCGVINDDDIYTRHDPDSLLCKGRHKEER